MSEDTDTKKEEVKKDAPKKDAPKAAAPKRAGRDNAGSRERRPFKKNTRARKGKRRESKVPEFEQKILAIRRVTRVMAGGRRFSFSVALAMGDKKGSVGVGTGKSKDTALAIEKAARSAKLNMIKIPLDENMRIPHEVQTKYASSEVWISPAKGKGLVAGSSVRTILELAGIRDVTAKILTRSKSKLNNAQVAIKALQMLKKVKKKAAEKK